MLLDGHARQKLMGDQVVPVVIMDISEAEEGAFLLTFDPLTGMASYSKDILRDLMESVRLRSDVLQAMVDDIAIKHRALPRPSKTGNDPGADLTRAAELQKKWKTKDGQVWRMPSTSLPGASHTLVIGDSTLPETWELLGLPFGQAACMWTDPPYGVSYKSAAGTIENDSKEGLRAFLVTAFRRALLRIEPGGRWYVAGPAGDQGTEFRLAFRDAYNDGTNGTDKCPKMEYRSNLIWVKSSLVLGHADYHYRHEDIHYGIVGGYTGRIGRGGKGWYGDNAQTSVIEINKPAKNDGHPTVKPVELIVSHLTNSTRVGDDVLEPFGGSGSTVVACEQLGRRAFAIELSPGYAAVILDRLLGMGCAPEQVKAPAKRRSQ